MNVKCSFSDLVIALGSPDEFKIEHWNFHESDIYVNIIWESLRGEDTL